MTNQTTPLYTLTVFSQEYSDDHTHYVGTVAALDAETLLTRVIAMLEDMTDYPVGDSGYGHGLNIGHITDLIEQKAGSMTFELAPSVDDVLEGHSEADETESYEMWIEVHGDATEPAPESSEEEAQPVDFFNLISAKDYNGYILKPEVMAMLADLKYSPDVTYKNQNGIVSIGKAGAGACIRRYDAEQAANRQLYVVTLPLRATAHNMVSYNIRDDGYVTPYSAFHGGQNHHNKVEYAALMLALHDLMPH